MIKPDPDFVAPSDVMISRTEIETDNLVLTALTENSQLSQKSVGLTTTHTIGPLQGIITQDHNLGGSFLFQNSSFAHCQTTIPAPTDSFIDAFSPFFQRALAHMKAPYSWSTTSFENQRFTFWDEYSSPNSMSDTSLYATFSTPILFTNCQFSHFSESAILLMTPVPLTVSGCSFTDCRKESGEGGAINTYAPSFFFAPTIRVKSSLFEDCYSSSGGGGIGCTIDGTHTITSSNFTSCESGYTGGGGSFSRAAVSYCRFVGNIAENGGGLYAFSASLSFCVFKDNVASSDRDWRMEQPDPSLDPVDTCIYLSLPSGKVDCLFVKEGGTSDLCTDSSPCSSLSTAVLLCEGTETEIRLGIGNVGAATLSNGGTITMCGLGSESDWTAASRTRSFSLTVEDLAANVSIENMGLVPIEGSHLVACSASNAKITIRQIKVSSVIGISSVPFVFTAGKVLIENCHFTHLTEMTSSLITTTGTCSLEIQNSAFEHITSTSPIISGETDLLIQKCIFRNLTRTEGSGAAALDSFNSDSLRIDALFTSCSSLAGIAGAVQVTLTKSSAFHSSQLVFCNNTAFGINAANDLHLSGDSLPKSNYVALYSSSATPSVIDPDGEHVPFSIDYIHVIDEDNLSGQLSSVPFVVTELGFLSLLQQRLSEYPSQFTVHLSTSSERPLCLPPLVIEKLVFELVGYTDPTIPLIAQTTSTSGPLFTVISDGEIFSSDLTFLISSDRTHPMIVVDETSKFNLHGGVLISQGQLLTQPFIQSIGTVILVYPQFSNLRFSGCSCVLIEGGTFTIDQDAETLRAHLNNVTTDGDGAFLHASSATVNIAPFVFGNCHARNGGALFLRDCPSVSMYSCIFTHCPASKDGGSIFVENHNTPGAHIAIEWCCFANCSAERGGGFFINTSASSSLSLFGGGDVDITYHSFSIPWFLGCTAQKGAGGFIDGLFDQSKYLNLQFSHSRNDECVCEGSDLYFTSDFAQSCDALEPAIRSLVESSASFSGHSLDPTGPFKHIHVENDPSLSCSLNFPELTLTEDDYEMYQECGNYFPFSCNSISSYLPLFHTRHDNDGYIPVPIYLLTFMIFFETGHVTEQWAILKHGRDIDDSQLTQTFIERGATYNVAENVFLEVGCDGTLELDALTLHWRGDHVLAQMVDPSATVIIAKCNFLFQHDIAESMIVCQSGSLMMSSTIFAHDKDPASVKVPLISSFSPSSHASNAEASTISIDISEVQFEEFSVAANTPVIELKDAQKITLSKITFSKVKLEDGSTEALRIAVRGSKLSEVIERVKGNGFPFRGGSDDALYLSTDLSQSIDDTKRDVTLLFYLSPFSGSPIIVGTRGMDGWGCGDSTFPCRSLDEADTHLNASPGTIEIFDSAVLQSELDFIQYKTKVTSQTGTMATLEVSVGGSLVNQADIAAHSLTIDSLLFSVQAGRTTPLMKSTSGSLSIESCSFSSSAPLDTKLVEITGGSMDMTKVTLTSLSFSEALITFSNFSTVSLFEVTHKNCPAATLLLFEGNGSDTQTITLKECDFHGPTTTNADEDTDLCEWTSGLIQIEKCSVDVISSTFLRLSQGAFRVVNGTLNRIEGTLDENSANDATFKSLNRNIRCTNGSVVRYSASSSDSVSSDSMWISTDGTCFVQRNNQTVSNPFFVPSLTLANCLATLKKGDENYEVVLKGTNLIPCGLSFIVRDNTTAKNDPKEFSISFPSDPSSVHNDTDIAFLVPSSNLSILTPKLGWVGLISFGSSGETDAFTFKMNSREALAQAMRKTLPWLIPLIIVVCAAIIVVIVVLVLRLRKKNKKPNGMSEMDQTDAVEAEDEKIEVMDGTQEGVHAGNQLGTEVEVRTADTERKGDSEQSSIPPTFNVIEALRCGDKLEMTVVREIDTLYNALHSDKRRNIVKRVVQRQLAMGLVKVADANLNPDILTKLSSHWVMFDKTGCVCLKTQDSIPTVLEPSPSPSPNEVITAGQAGQRWKAPEVVKMEEQKDTTSVFDAHKAAVFSLGLVLWEIETGLVPFGEIDAVNAQRQLGTGVLPKMEGVPKSMQEIIKACLNLVPDDRPSLSTVSSELISLSTVQLDEDDELLIQNGPSHNYSE
ncbi:hypothetical protein BLNAU_14189 [Blattamonas nauphoetae]|uniref:Protein kinase domain-containing protein n=1 Tax=Blattamonas nauphoetae TaxID=2049346 RepID=A0ABQ9XEJ2_9EUKA|nr:hypothetical protein BLNAU_14189 [Blattamonas nauphoetae]